MAGLIEFFSWRRGPHRRSCGATVRVALGVPVWLVSAAMGGLAGCSLNPPAAVSDVRYDLGPAPDRAAASLPTVRVFDVHAPRALDTDAILYRLSYVDPRRTAAYAHSHWTMTPALLLTQRLRIVLAANGAVLDRGDVAATPRLSIELEQFEQVYDGEGESHGALSARATLTRDGRVIAQRTFVARAPASTPSAAGAAASLAAASDAFIAQLIAWLGMQATLASQ